MKSVVCAVSLAILLSLTFVSTQASGDAPTVRQLQNEIGRAGGWERDSGPYIWIVGTGGSCVCKIRNPDGTCQVYQCGGNDAGNKWGPIRVPRPALTIQRRSR